MPEQLNIQSVVYNFTIRTLSTTELNTIPTEQINIHWVMSLINFIFIVDGHYVPFSLNTFV